MYLNLITERRPSQVNGEIHWWIIILKVLALGTFSENDRMFELFRRTRTALMQIMFSNLVDELQQSSRDNRVWTRLIIKIYNATRWSVYILCSLLSFNAYIRIKPNIYNFIYVGPGSKTMFLQYLMEFTVCVLVAICRNDDLINTYLPLKHDSKLYEPNLKFALSRLLKYQTLTDQWRIMF